MIVSWLDYFAMFIGYIFLLAGAVALLLCSLGFAADYIMGQGDNLFLFKEFLKWKRKNHKTLFEYE